MNKQWKVTLAAMACVLCVASPFSGADTENHQPSWQAASDARAWDQHDLLNLQVEGGTTLAPVVRLEADGPLEFESFVLDGPDRLVVDLLGVVSRLEQYSYAVEDRGLVRIRAAQHQLDPMPVTRVVFDLDQPLAYRIAQDRDALEIRFGGASAVHAGATDPVEAAEPVAIHAPPPVDPKPEPEPEPIVAIVASEPAPEAVAADVPSYRIIGDRIEGIEMDAAGSDEPMTATVSTEGERPQLVELGEPDTLESARVRNTSDDPIAELLGETPSEDTTRSATSRSIDEGAIDALLEPAPTMLAPTPEPEPQGSPTFQSKTIRTDQVVYTGKRISLNLVDADIKQVFRLFHEISGLNFVLDPDVGGRVTIVLDQVPWDQALDLILKNNGLDKELERNVLRIATTQKLAQEAAARKQRADAQELEQDLATLTRRLSYAKAIDVQEMLSGRGGRGGGGAGQGQMLSPRGSVLVDERTNTIIISDIPDRVEAVDQLIETIDAEAPQVMIEARIVETTRTFSKDVGVIWGFDARADASTGTSTGLSFPNNASAAYSLNLPAGDTASQLSFGFGNILDSFTLDLTLQALESQGMSRILSAPKIAAQNNERAEIEQGVRFPIVNTTATEINVEFVSASLKLTVTPQITAEGTVLMDIVVENNSPDFSQLVAGIPSIGTQRAQTKVLTQDGGTTVIGGIFTVNEAESEQGVPWFKKIPVFGRLFRSNNVTKDNRELLIFITPKIIKLG